MEIPFLPSWLTVEYPNENNLNVIYRQAHVLFIQPRTNYPQYH